MSELSYTTLREIQKKELEDGALVELKEDFYSSICELMEFKKKEATDGKSILALREYENIKKIVSAIQSKREEKILLMALRSEKSYLGLTNEERELLAILQDLLRKHREKVKISEEPSLQKLRVLKEVSEYKVEGQTFGPFRKGEVYFLPKKEAEWLLKESMAEMIV
jgi:hypothetical protein